MKNVVEDKYLPAFEAWQSNQTPEGNVAFLKEIDPIVQKGVQMYGGSNPLAQSKAKLLALKAAQKFDPSRSRLQSHMITNLQELQRIGRKQQEIIKVPERTLLENYRLNQGKQELEDTLGREPTDAEISDHLGISLDRLTKIRKFQPGISSSQAEGDETNSSVPASHLPGAKDNSDYWANIVYQDLGPLDQKIMELSLGMFGNRQLSNLEIAKKLNRSPGAITQRKIKIQKLLDQEQQYSPFIG